jgi:hypothetical protein
LIEKVSQPIDRILDIASKGVIARVLPLARISRTIGFGADLGCLGANLVA